MPENRKYFAHKQVLLVGARTEEGLPLVSSLVLNLIIWGILARARSMYQVRVCHFIFMFNHFHMMLVVDNPEDVSNFVGYVKGEIAHAVNQLLGRRRKTLWAEGYDSPVILTARDVLRYIGYIYVNPAKANLVDRIDEYPGVSSWQMFTQDRRASCHKWIRRPAIKKLQFPALTIGEQRRMVESLDRAATLEHEFVLEPFAWLECFPESVDRSEDEVKEEIIEAVRKLEAERRLEREENNRKVIGATALRRQSMLKEYQPKKSGKRMLCLCSEKPLRARFIDHFRALCDAARKAYERWKKGDLRAKMPPGMFAPRVPVLASAFVT